MAKNILIVTGGTTDKIDRFVSINANSKGATGLYLAQYLSQDSDNKIYLLASKNIKISEILLANCDVSYFSSVDSLDSNCENILGSVKIDFIIMSGVISDYSPYEIKLDEKWVSIDSLKEIPYNDEFIDLRLKKNKKIIKALKGYSSNPSVKVISFRMTKTDNQEVIAQKLKSIQECPAVDFLVHNDLNFLTNTSHKTTIYDGFQPIFTGATKEELAENIRTIINNY